jgi:hypothetical protein
MNEAPKNTQPNTQDVESGRTLPQKNMVNVTCNCVRKVSASAHMRARSSVTVVTMRWAMVISWFKRVSVAAARAAASLACQNTPECSTRMKAG